VHEFIIFVTINTTYFLTIINQLLFVKRTEYVLHDERTESLNVIKMTLNLRKSELLVAIG